MPLLGPDGKPVKSPGDPLGELIHAPVLRDRGDYVEVPKALIEDIRRERARKLAITSVPTTPRHMQRDIGGMAVGKGHGRWPHITMEMLRDLRERAPILQPIHQARGYQVRRLCVPWPGRKGTVGIRVVHKDHMEHDSIPPSGFQPWIDRFKEFLWRPAPSYGINTLGTACTLLMEDLLTINHPVIEMIPSAVDAKRVVQWRPVDGGVIWPTLHWLEKWKADHPRWSVGYDLSRLSEDDMIDIASASINHDLHGAEYVLVREGIAEAVYSPGRLIVFPIQNRTDMRFAGYPPSNVEMAIALVSAFMSAFDYNASYFTKGMLAEFILGLPADMHDDDVDAFLEMFREVTQGVENAWRPPVLPMPRGGGEIQKIDLKQSNREMMYEVFHSLTMSLTAAIYRIHMSVLNAKAWDAGAGAPLNEGNHTAEIALAKEEGLQGDMGHIIENGLNPMAMRCHPHLRVIAEYGDYDPEKEAKVYEIRGRTDMSRNEIRVEQGLEPRQPFLTMEEYKTAAPEEQAKHDDNPWNWPTDPGFANAIAQAKQREQQAQMFAQQMAAGQQPPPGGDLGDGSHDDGYGGRDDGFGGAHPLHADPAPYGKPGGAPGPQGAQNMGGAPPAPPKAGPPAPLAKGGPGRITTVHLHDRFPR